MSVEVKWCANPMGIKGHWNRKCLPSQMFTVSTEFYEQYSGVCKKLKIGAEICDLCYDRISKVKGAEKSQRIFQANVPILLTLMSISLPKGHV